MIYLLLGALFAAATFVMADKRGIPFPEEFQTGFSKAMLFGMFATSWPFCIAWVIAHLKNNT